MASQQYPSQKSYPPPDALPPPYVEPVSQGPSQGPSPGPSPGQSTPTPPQGTSRNMSGNVQYVIVEKPAHKEKKGFFSSVLKEAEKVGKQISVQIDKAGEKINETVDKNYTSALLDLFKTGNVVQLISRVTGRTVQIVVNTSGHLILDANGPLDPGAFNTLWTVTNEGQNQVRLHNYNNYIAIHDGLSIIVPYSPGLETKFQLSQVQQQFIMLESLKEKARHLAFLPTGELKPALASGKEADSQFGVKLVSTAYPVITPVTTHK